MHKKLLSLLLILLISLSAVAGCTGGGQEGGGLRYYELPADGVVRASVWNEIKESGATAVFNGNSNGEKYQLTVFSGDIREARDTNLSVTFFEPSGYGVPGASRTLGVRFDNEVKPGFSPVLTIIMEEDWGCQTVDVYRADNGGDPRPLSSATIDRGAGFAVSFTVPAASGEYIIAGMEGAGPSAATVSPSPSPDSTPLMDAYLSKPGQTGEKDAYLTDPIPEGKPHPVEPGTSTPSGNALKCVISIDCLTILDNMGDFNRDKLEVLPSDGIILAPVTVTFYEGESVFDVLARVTRERGIHMESVFTPIYNSAYVEGINNIYEFDCGNLSGWMYSVNGWYPNYGCSRYALTDGDVIKWRYTCDLGRDVGCDWDLAG